MSSLRSLCLGPKDAVDRRYGSQGASAIELLGVYDPDAVVEVDLAVKEVPDLLALVFTQGARLRLWGPTGRFAHPAHRCPFATAQGLHKPDCAADSLGADGRPAFRQLPN